VIIASLDLDAILTRNFLKMDNIENTRDYKIVQFMPLKCHKCNGELFGVMLLRNADHQWFLRCMNNKCNNIIHIIIENGKVDLCDTTIKLNREVGLN